MTIEHKPGTSLIAVSSSVIVLDPYTPSPSEDAFVHQFGRKIIGQPAAEQIASMVHNAYSNPFRDKTGPSASTTWSALHAPASRTPAKFWPSSCTAPRTH